MFLKTCIELRLSVALRPWMLKRWPVHFRVTASHSRTMFCPKVQCGAPSVRVFECAPSVRVFECAPSVRVFECAL